RVQRRGGVGGEREGGKGGSRALGLPGHEVAAGGEVENPADRQHGDDEQRDEEGLARQPRAHVPGADHRHPIPIEDGKITVSTIVGFVGRKTRKRQTISGPPCRSSISRVLTERGGRRNRLRSAGFWPIAWPRLDRA